MPLFNMIILQMFCLGGAVRPLENGGVSTVFLFQGEKRTPPGMVSERSKNRIPTGFWETSGSMLSSEVLRDSKPSRLEIDSCSAMDAAKAFYKRPEHTNSTANAMPP